MNVFDMEEVKVHKDKGVQPVKGAPKTDMSGVKTCLLYTSPSPRDGLLSRMPSSA